MLLCSLPDSLGRLFKVQLWHNNAGEAPSWFLSRVVVRDVNAGTVYYFKSVPVTTIFSHVNAQGFILFTAISYCISFHF